MAKHGINKVIILGNIGTDVEVRHFGNGDAVVNITVATSESWKDKGSGEKQERTEWHKVVFYRRLAEIVGEFCKKGTKVYIEGRLHTRKWQDKNGADVYTTEIVADELQILSAREAIQNKAPHMPRVAAPVESGFDDDIPF